MCFNQRILKQNIVNREHMTVIPLGVSQDERRAPRNKHSRDGNKWTETEVWYRCVSNYKDL